MQNYPQTLPEIRCGACSRKLGTGQFTLLQIKCPRCGTLNHLRATCPQPERPRAPSAITDNEQQFHSKASASVRG